MIDHLFCIILNNITFEEGDLIYDSTYSIVEKYFLKKFFKLNQQAVIIFTKSSSSY